MSTYQADDSTGEIVYRAVEPEVRGMPYGVRGAEGTMHASTILDLGAHASVTGFTRSKINGMLDEAQKLALNAVIASYPKLLEHSRHIAQAKLNEVAVRIDRLKRLSLHQPLPPQGLLSRLAPQQMQPYWGPALEDAPAYISYAEVKTILAEVIAILTVPE
jgi:hypothetical protein